MKYNLRVFWFSAFFITAHLAGGISSAKNVQTELLARDEAMLIGKAHVYDGDSLFFGKVEVRLDAVDAPERDQACRDGHGKFWACGIAARDALRKLAGSGEVKCSISGRDRYRRLLGTCYASEHDLNAAMVESGNAIAYHHFSERYAAQESRAQTKRRGIWQDAAFTEPYYCRHFAPGHTCYEYDYRARQGRVAPEPLIGKSHAIGAPD